MSDKPRRINVAVNEQTVEALEFIIEREGVTLTEAVRRLLGYGEFVYREVKQNGHSLVVHRDDGSTHEVVLL